MRDAKDFPLWLHKPSGYWCRKVRGKRHYFSKDKDEALTLWLEQKDDLLAGRKPRIVTRDGLTVREACNYLLTSKEERIATGELSKRQFDDLYRACELVISSFGPGRMVEDLRPDDFRDSRQKMAKQWGPSSLRREVTNVRSIFNYAYKNDLVDRPVKFGTEFSGPSKKTLRKARHQTGERMLEPEQLRRLIDAASLHVKPMLLLALNAGYLVPTEFGLDIVVLREQFGKIRQVADVVMMDSDRRTDPKLVSGLTSFIVGESSPGTESDVTWQNLTLTAKKMMTLSRMSGELSADAAISYGDRLVGEIAYSQSLLEDTIGFNGDGSSTHGSIRGVRTLLTDVDGSGTSSAGLITQDTGSTWGAIVVGDFHKVVAACPQYSLVRNPIWIMSTSFYHEVCAPLAIASAGGALISETREMIGGARADASFLGFPVVFSQSYPTATSTDDVVCSFGSHDLGVRMGDRQNTAVLFSEHATVSGESMYERDQIGVRATHRFDINVHGAGDADDAGPIVGLATGS